jgi:hypothetical protein
MCMRRILDCIERDHLSKKVLKPNRGRPLHYNRRFGPLGTCRNAVPRRKPIYAVIFRNSTEIRTSERLLRSGSRFLGTIGDRHAEREARPPLGSWGPGPFRPKRRQRNN